MSEAVTAQREGTYHVMVMREGSGYHRVAQWRMDDEPVLMPETKTTNDELALAKAVVSRLAKMFHAEHPLLNKKGVAP